MPAVTYVGKHSKDGALSIYIAKRVYVDEGQGIEPVMGIVKMDRECLSRLDPNQAVFLAVNCYFIFEGYEYESDIIDHTIYERSVQIYPKTDETASIRPRKKMALPDEYHVPYEMQLPVGLPPSVTLNPGFVYFGRPIGISYEMSAYIGSVRGKAEKGSRVALRFRKSSYFPSVSEFKPLKTETKTFLGSSKEMVLKAYLDREIYEVGQPIIVNVELDNQTKHDVHAIRISVKQCVEARVMSNDKERFKCQVAFSESSHGCPVRKGGFLRRTYTVTPTIMKQDSMAISVAQTGRLNMSETPQLAPSFRDSELPKDRKGLSISYYVNIHAVLSLASDLIVKLPFIISGNERRDDDEKDESASAKKVEPISADPKDLLNQLIKLGFPADDAKRALKKFDMNFELAFDHLSSKTDKNAEDFSISLEDAEVTSSSNINLAVKPVSILEDINRAGEMVGALRKEFAEAQQSIMSSTSVSEPTSAYADITTIIDILGEKMHEFLSDVSENAKSSVSASDAATQLKELTNSVSSIANSTKSAARTELLSLMHDVLEKFFILLATARDCCQSSSQAYRTKLRNLADYLSGTFSKLRSALPGQREVDIAIQTIEVAVTELENTPFSSAISGEELQSALDTINDAASSLSAVFQKLGTVAFGPAAEFAKVASDYRVILPKLLSSGQLVLSGMTNEKARQSFLALLQGVGTSNIQLLHAAANVNTANTNQQAKKQLQLTAKEVVEVMKKLLQASNALQTQLKSPSPVRKEEKKPQGVADRSSAGAMPAPFNRRDSFDEFIVHRTGAKTAKPTSGEAAKQSSANTAGGNPSEVFSKVVDELESAVGKLMKGRAGPRRQSVVAGYDDKAPGNSVVIDQAIDITRAAIQLVNNASERLKEIAIIGQAFSDAKYKSDKELEDTIVSAAQELSAKVQETANNGLDVAAGRAGPTILIKPTREIGEAATKLLAATRVKEASAAQQQLEQSYKDLTYFSNRLLTFGEMAASESVDSSQSASEGTKESEIEQQLRILRLEQELERERLKVLFEKKQTRKPPKQARKPKQADDGADVDPD